MLYPCILFGLLITLITMIILLLTWLRPTIISLNEQSGQSLKTISWISQFSKVIGGGMLLIGCGYLCYGIYWLRKQPSIARHQWISKLPVIGRLYRNYSYYYLSFNLALLLKSGLDFREICNFLCQFESSTLLYQLGNRLKQHLLTGKEIKTFIKEYSFIPPELTIFLNKGQSAYELSEDLLIYFNNRYQKLIKMVDQLISMIQPVAFLIIALIIIGIYLSILIPIYSNLGGLS